MEPTLDVLFDSPARVRVLKFFLYGQGNFTAAQAAKILKIKLPLIHREFKKLLAVGFIRPKIVRGKKAFFANRNFVFYKELENLFRKCSPASKERILERLPGLGRIKLVLLAGIFINSDDSKADLMIVGDKIKTAKLNQFLGDLEAEIGREINCAVMTTKEFQYRYGMYDRFVRDLLEFKHEKLINKLRI